jgi:hypothetical protein
MMHVLGGPLADECTADMFGLLVARSAPIVQAAGERLNAVVHIVGHPADGLGRIYSEEDVVALMTIEGRPFTARKLWGDERHSRWILQEGHTAGIVTKAAA